MPWFHSGILGNGVMSRVFGGWTVNGFTEAQSGQPFTILTGVDTYGVGSTAARPDYNPGGTITLDPVSPRLPHLHHAAQRHRHCRHPPGPERTAAGRFAGRSSATSAGTPSADPARTIRTSRFIKKVAITERVALQFRAEFFDIFNHRNFGNPSSNMSSPSFGQNTSDPGGRQILLSGRVMF